jgi:hypothetical protein
MVRSIGGVLVGRVKSWFRVELQVEDILLEGPSRAAKARRSRSFSPQAEHRTPVVDPADRGQFE